MTVMSTITIIMTRSVRLYRHLHPLHQLRSYVQEYIRSRPIPEIKLVTAPLVLGLVTALEYGVL